MICPVCKSDMIVVERNRIELDHCTNCGGAWFDAGELELLLASLGVGDPRPYLGKILREREAKTNEKPRRCPICAQRMRKANVGERPKILIDACPKGDGIWFDGGELEQLLAEISREPMSGHEYDRRVSDFLGDMFQAYPATRKKK